MNFLILIRNVFCKSFEQRLVIYKIDLILICMEPQFRVTQNWLTKKLDSKAYDVTFWMTLLLLFSGFVFLSGYFNSDAWMPANPKAVFKDFQLWRLWTALFAHGDVGHLMSNSLLFLPLTFLLSAYFGMFVFPVLGLLMGGLINYIVLLNMPLNNSLIGMSGVVYWMGAIWLTLFVLIDTRKSIRKRIAVAVLLTAVLFAPETYKPDVSYLSHFIGYVLGIVTGIGYYAFHRKAFQNAEVKEEVIEDDLDFFKSEQDGVQLRGPGISEVL